MASFRARDFLIIALTATHVVAAATPPESKQQQPAWLQTGSCRAVINEDALPRLSPFCLNLLGGLERSVQPNTQTGEFGVVYVRANLGIHLNPYISVHMQALRRKLHLVKSSVYGESPSSIDLLDDRNTEQAFLQLGNPGLTKLRLALGRIELPYGIDFLPTSQISQQTQTAVQYQSFPFYALRLTYENLNDTGIQLGIASQAAETLISRKNRLVPSDKSSSGLDPVTAAYRIYTDLPYMNAVRLYHFGFASDNGEKRIGAGMLHRSDREDATVLEWHRRNLAKSLNTTEFQQLFRIYYLTPYQSHRRWSLGYEDSRQDYRLFHSGMDYKLTTKMIFKLHLTYYWADHGRYGSYFQVVQGLEAKL